MAQKVEVLLIDDLDGKTADQTVAFALDGTGYEIDLSEKNAAKLRDALALYVGAARRISKSGRPYRKTDLGPHPREIRAWAARNGIEVNGRGRIPAEIVEKYKADNPN